ncbi:hypothetical protein [Nocardia sp. NPDC050710]|uniref:hypothetical protein n=1 Tax=Nocardia sp. NPDC050710 TaxID=3157220 RepID=UPI0033DE90B4
MPVDLPQTDLTFGLDQQDRPVQAGQAGADHTGQRAERSADQESAGVARDLDRGRGQLRVAVQRRRHHGW